MDHRNVAKSNLNYLSEQTVRVNKENGAAYYTEYINGNETFIYFIDKLRVLYQLLVNHVLAVPVIYEKSSKLSPYRQMLSRHIMLMPKL